MLLTAKEWFFLFFLLFFIIYAVSWIIYSRFSFPRIERKLLADGYLDIFLLSGVVVRPLLFALVIVLPDKAVKRLPSLVDAYVIRAYATKADRWLGLLVLCTSYGWLIVLLIAYLLLP